MTLIRQLGTANYAEVFARMQAFNDARNGDSVDEIWLVEHPPVFTQGLAGKAEHVLNPGAIPIIQTDRGGQVTYHGPGQIVVYPLLNLKRLKIGPKALVHGLEQILIDELSGLDIHAARASGAPGVYVDEKKIASLGLRIRHGCSYHGLALNVNLDMSPFTQINPCGYANLSMTQLADFERDENIFVLGQRLAHRIVNYFELADAQVLPKATA
ncbi:MAG: lipoyl(octanoyl) transferase LipB [Oceanococcus sp.]